VLAWRLAFEVDCPHSSSGTTTPVPHDYPTAVIPSALAMTDFGEGKLKIGLALVEMVVDRSLQMSDTGCSGLYVFSWNPASLRIGAAAGEKEMAS